MAYGPLTSMTIGKLNSGSAFLEANSWSPDDYTLPFAERLMENIAEYHDLPSGESDRKLAALSLIREGAELKGIRMSRNTLHEWLQNSRDPSVSSSDRQTRENIYKLCAALNYDYELTQELFEKVFFTRAFNPKDRKELAFRYYAWKEYSSNTEEACNWYQKGETAVAEAGKLFDVRSSSGAIKDSAQIVDLTILMTEKEFITFLAANTATFARDNESVAARDAVKKAALEAWRQLEKGKLASQDSIPYEALLAHIVGYSQRTATLAVGAVSSLKSLPPQLTTNFPTGQILRKICLDEECSYDQVYKMLSLLLFFCYFAHIVEKADTERSFLDFLRFANMSLDRAGCQALSPHQPYGGLLLFCAAQKDPLSSLRTFLQSRIDEESEAVLQEEMKKAFPHWRNSSCLDIVRQLNRDPFLVRMLVGTYGRFQDPPVPEQLTRYSTDEEALMLFFYESSSFSDREKAVLRYFSLFPPEGVSDNLLEILLAVEELKSVKMLLSQNWLVRKKDRLSMDYRIRRAVNGQLDFPQFENCLSLIQAVKTINLDSLNEKDRKNLEKIRKKVSQLERSRQNNG